MADESIEDGEFWLPSQFLEDNDLHCDDSGSSDLSSLVESVASSGEDWSDEEDYLAGLRKKVASTALDDDVNKLDFEKCKDWFGSGSPKSTLLGVGGGCDPTKQRLLPVILQEATGKVAPMSMREQVQPYGPDRKTANSGTGFFPQLPLSQPHLEAIRLQRMRYQQKIQWQMLTGQYQVVSDGTFDLQWPPLQSAQQKNRHMPHQIGRPGAGTTRAVLARAPGARPCTGTGVFLPRQAVPEPVLRKKQARSPVLIPAKVVQALNMKFEGLGPQSRQQLRSRPIAGRFTSESGNADGWARRCKSKGAGAEPRQHMVNNEVKLPQEWTY